MTGIPAALAAHLDQPVTTLCNCWRLTRADGMAFGFTDHDRPLAVDGTSFAPQSGLSGSEARQSLGLAPDTVDVAGALTSDLVTDADIDAGLYDRAEVETLLVNWRDPAAFTTICKAVIGRITRADGRFTAELESPDAALDQPNGRYFRKRCDAELGDARCGFDLGGSGFHGAGTVMAVRAGNIVEVDGLAGFADGWFSGGRIDWTTGTLTGSGATVITHEADDAGVALTLDIGSCGEPAVDDEFTIVAGCDKRFATCKGKFNNALNFRGFPHLPGNDAAYAYVRDGLVFDGGPLVP
ncbi:MAG: DUF2163 domain-containing protein [Rhizobiaceae bacterium]